MKRILLVLTLCLLPMLSGCLMFNSETRITDDRKKVERQFGLMPFLMFSTESDVELPPAAVTATAD